ncbi:hypothetical protein Thimo_0172 [Thioflavicoccus mobilis 8321]|uniref:Uncharacterized protein n=1 Tax=Thioflavicoccus mobilis 8321 TaxID=765912 RepID=L0GTB0_9GAMM|nr:hypothetical protein Thimo_0172 [Thioflavicoccus mobilis 8321]
MLDLLQRIVPVRRNRWHQYVIVTLLMAPALLARLAIAPSTGGSST